MDSVCPREAGPCRRASEVRQSRAAEGGGGGGLGAVARAGVCKAPPKR